VGLKHLIAIEKWTCLLGLVLLGCAMLLLSRHAAFSLAVGAALTALNAVVIRRVAEKLGVLLQARPGLTILLFNLKMGVLVVLIFLALRFLHLDAVPFIVGLSTLPAAIVIVFLQHALSPSPPPSASSDPTNRGETHG
jgi:hypothetical protein